MELDHLPISMSKTRPVSQWWTIPDEAELYGEVVPAVEGVCMADAVVVLITLAEAAPRDMVVAAAASKEADAAAGGIGIKWVWSQ